MELAQRLGLFPEDRIELSLHNLLLYEKGQFFARHQDTEKLPDMLASLVIVLPCQHTGGELLVEKKGETKSFALDNGHLGRALAILFYADCHHQVKPVKTGNRLALTYNVTVRQKPRDQIAQANGLTHSIMRYFSGQHSEKFKRKTPLVVLLDHQYTQKSLSWSRLKGRDRTTVDQFLANKESCGLAFSRALVDVQETRDAYADDGYGYDQVEEDWDEDEDEDLEEGDNFSPKEVKSGSARPAPRRRIYITRRQSIEPGALISIAYSVIHCVDESGPMSMAFCGPDYKQIYVQ